MARPRSEAKREALLAAAVSALAEKGGVISTGDIASRADVADGTLYVYFESKDGLLNTLYLELKASQRAYLTAALEGATSTEEKIKRLWHGLVKWSVTRPQDHAALMALGASGRLMPHTLAAGNEAYAELYEIVRHGMEEGVLRLQPLDFLGGIMLALAELTIRRASEAPEKSKDLTKLGWQATWNALQQPK